MYKSSLPQGRVDSAPSGLLRSRGRACTRTPDAASEPRNLHVGVAWAQASWRDRGATLLGYRAECPQPSQRHRSLPSQRWLSTRTQSTVETEAVGTGWVPAQRWWRGHRPRQGAQAYTEGAPRAGMYRRRGTVCPHTPPQGQALPHCQQGDRHQPTHTAQVLRGGSS